MIRQSVPSNVMVAVVKAGMSERNSNSAELDLFIESRARPGRVFRNNPGVLKKKNLALDRDKSYFWKQHSVHRLSKLAIVGATGRECCGLTSAASENLRRANC